MIGLGGYFPPNELKSPYLMVFLGKYPPLDEYENQEVFRPVDPQELLSIGHKTGNHWRKIINCYAKLAYEVDDMQQTFARWQEFRDEMFLQSTSAYGICFSEPELGFSGVSVLMGKSYGETWACDNKLNLTWIDSYFAVNIEHRVIVSPYFDYRQLNNQKITQLAVLIQSLR